MSTGSKSRLVSFIHRILSERRHRITSIIFKLRTARDETDPKAPLLPETMASGGTRSDRFRHSTVLFFSKTDRKLMIESATLNKSRAD